MATSPSHADSPPTSTQHANGMSEPIDAKMTDGASNKVHPINATDDAATTAVITLPSKEDSSPDAKLLDDSSPDKKPGNAPKGRGGKPTGPKVSIPSLFRFATSFDFLLLGLGLAGSAARGALQPMVSLLLGGIISGIIAFTPTQGNTVVTPEVQKARDDFRDQINYNVIWYCIFAAISVVAGYVQSAALTISAERQLKTIREEYFKSILRQDIGWFDDNMTGDLTSRLQSDTGLVKSGIGEKLGNVFQAIAQFFTGIIIAYVRGWKMALVLTALLPLNIITLQLMGRFLGAAVAQQQTWLAKASAVAQQVFSGVRTVHSFSGFEKSRLRYEQMLAEAAKYGNRVGFTTGIGLGTVFLFMFTMQGVGYYFAATLIYNREYDGGQAVNVFFAMLMAIFALSSVGSDISQVAISQGAAYKIWQTVDRVSPIDSWSEDGKKPDSVKGDIVFTDVSFFYKSRPGQVILNKFSLSIPAGSKVALVGESGSGKSTIVKLVMQFYNPTEGSVTLDGTELKSLNVQWLRRQMGIVGQEPALFDGSIRANVLMGIPDLSKFSATELEQKVLRAIKMANADFVLNLPAGLDTMVGERGAMLSGGQKQRIAIARAVIGDPKILLFDEATSALDTASEKVVQRAIDKASENRTSITVAHRLSTIKNADMIVVMSHGEIVEKGSHDELVSKAGPYARLVEAQKLKESEEAASEDEEEDRFVEIEEEVLAEAEANGEPNGAIPLTESRHPSSRINITDKKHSSKHSVGDEKGSNARIASTTRIVSAKAIAEKRTSSSRIAMDQKLTSKVDIAKALEAAEKEEEEMKKTEREKYADQPIPWGEIARIAWPSWPAMLVGSIGSLAAGAIQPVMSILLSGMLGAFALQGDAIINEARFYCIMYFVLGVGQLIIFGSYIGAWGVAGEQFTLRLRSLFFYSLVKQEIAYFDDPRNNVGALTAKLADDATQVKGLFNDVLSAGLQIVGTLVAGLTIAFIHGWKFTLVVLAVVPIFVAAFVVQARTQTFFGRASRVETIETNKIANEAISQIRTVAMLTKEKLFWDRYCHDLIPPFQKSVKGAITSSFAAGASAGIQFLFLAFAWWYGGTLVYNLEYTGQQLQQCLFAMLFTAMSLGRATSFAPSLSKAQVAAGAVFAVLHRTPSINATSTSGASPPASGEANARDVHFTYPFRNSFPVLRGVNIEAKAGQTVALVGPSGSGKSSTIGLIERFYDVSSGTLTVDGTSVSDWNLLALRSRMALVGQEPVLFDGTISENIAYGLPDGAVVSQELVEAAARQANAYAFVSKLKDGFETQVGESGALLSGGQKQRIAIARALVRNPKFLLLDEATSALDSESEKVVQAALDDARQGRTTIVIAHRLSSIQNADRIYVINAGLVEEFGTHSQLMERKGLYWELAVQQSLGAGGAK
ncbi:P-loop containing nucleoside triphosphate hydrolase protein [Gonapodya prolifera JEL478]|uniref:p-loop containing nucleoside triphosphate hydrolase protein n=1 Tax=Gonapodya prolifera (strain JEL478) TaxID=1344416 RepID=A0A139AH16_GONPJ|nr:P-loop containing nucleoside triphosphate hydrolase protein [Gonapodya prolifera JEL478]|eukprot:KXS15989.1 P-loop containing nucleoside triphosphate hydrolase protein [Gonapodya prolifera JEL478]